MSEHIKSFNKNNKIAYKRLEEHDYESYGSILSHMSSIYKDLKHEISYIDDKERVRDIEQNLKEMEVILNKHLPIALDILSRREEILRLY